MNFSCRWKINTYKQTRKKKTTTKQRTKEARFSKKNIRFLFITSSIALPVVLLLLFSLLKSFCALDRDGSFEWEIDFGGVKDSGYYSKEMRKKSTKVRSGLWFVIDFILLMLLVMTNFWLILRKGFKYVTSSFWIYSNDGDLLNSALLI